MPIDPNILLLIVAAALLIFMFWSSSRRRKKMQAEEQKRQASLVPGTPVMTRTGLYGTLVSFDADDLTKRAVIAIAPGVEVEVHAQSITIDQESLNAEGGADEPVDDEADDIEDVDDVVEEFDGAEDVLDVDDRPADDPGDEKKN